MTRSTTSSTHSTRKILVDDRRGSKELLPELRKLSIPAELERLQFGDFAFTGNGPKGEVLIGVERKTVSDLISSITGARLSARQLPGMVQTYPYRWIYVEGLWRSGRDSRIEIFKEWWERPTKKGGGRMVLGAWFPASTQISWFQLAGRIVNLQVKGACWVDSTISMRDTAAKLGVLFHWWGKPWSVHRGHLQLEKGLTPDKILYARPSYPRLVANVLPGIGWEKSKAVARHFHTIEAMVEAGPGEWRKVAGIGKKLGERLPAIMRGHRGVDRAREE